MNRRKLTAHLDALEKLAAQLRADLEEAERADPFAVHVYRSRRECREVERTDCKSGKRGMRFAEESYGKAVQLGYRGGVREWQAILWAPMEPLPTDPSSPY